MTHGISGIMEVRFDSTYLFLRNIRIRVNEWQKVYISILGHISNLICCSKNNSRIKDDLLVLLFNDASK